MKLFAFAAVSAVFLSACADVSTISSRNRIVEVGNETGVTMTRFHASNTSRTKWEENIFGTDVLATGRSINIDIDDGSGACMFDLKAEFADGDIVVENDFNVCTQASWTVS
jgi:hypothetical protein